MSFTPSSRFCRTNTKYVEREPLVSETTCTSDVHPRFGRLEFYPEGQQIKTAEDLNSAELLQSALETSAIPSSSTMDSKLYSPSVDSLHSLDSDCKSQTACIYSSTPNLSAGKRASLFNASKSLFPKTPVSSETSEDGGFEQRGRTSSKSFSTAGALRSSGAFSSWRLPRWSDPKGTSVVDSRKPAMVDSRRSPAEPVRKMSSFQADYWACAIPDTLPPSPDRQSPHWNPNKEYEDLLDYTYPIRPKYKLAKDLGYGMHESSIHDSGIGLDTFSVSPESTLQSTSVPDQEHHNTEVQSMLKFQTPLLKKPGQSSPFSHYRLSLVGKVSFADASPSVGRTIFARESEQSLHPRCPGPGPPESTNVESMKGHSCITRNVRKHDCVIQKGAAGGFIRSTRMLPLRNECYSDEEYLSLPPRLEELETLARQLTELSLTVRKPGHDHSDDFLSTTVDREHRPLAVRGSDGGRWEIDGDSSRVGSSEGHGEEDLLHHRGCEDCFSTATETVSACAGNFVGTECLEIGSEHETEEEDGRRDSLAYRIKVFCCRLEELIGWLHKIAELTDNWIPPEPDVESVKASLQSYLAFKKDLASHQALTEGVLQDGEKLLESLASNSPVLQRTLGLIAKQSSELESNADRLYESILEALDALDASLRNSCEARPSAATAEASKWLMSSTL